MRVLGVYRYNTAKVPVYRSTCTEFVSCFSHQKQQQLLRPAFLLSQQICNRCLVSMQLQYASTDTTAVDLVLEYY